MFQASPRGAHPGGAGLSCGFALTNNAWIATFLLIPIAFCIYSCYSSMAVLGQTYLARNIGLAGGVTLGLATTGGLFMQVMGAIADQWGLSTAFLVHAFITLLGVASS